MYADHAIVQPAEPLRPYIWRYTGYRYSGVAPGMHCGLPAPHFAAKPASAFTEARRVLSADGKVGIVVWAPPNESQQPRIMAAISALAPPQPSNAPGPFALSAPGKLGSVLEEAGLRLVDRGVVRRVTCGDGLVAGCIRPRARG